MVISKMFVTSPKLVGLGGGIHNLAMSLQIRIARVSLARHLTIACTPTLGILPLREAASTPQPNLSPEKLPSAPSAGNANRWAETMQKEILKYLEENPGANYYEVSMLFAPRRSKVGYPKGYSDYSCVRRVLNNIVKRGYAKLDGQRLYICPTLHAPDAAKSAAESE